MSVPKRFAVLRFFGTLMKVLAWIWLVGAIVAALGLGIGSSILSLLPIGSDWIGQVQDMGIWAGLGSLIVGLFVFLLYYVLGEFIQMQLAMEENTRLTAALLLKMHQESQVEEGSGYSPGGFTSEPFDG